MKRGITLLFLVLALLISSTVCFAAGNELRVSPYYLIPDNDAAWDNAIGLEVQYIIWNTPNLGFALAGGIGKWQSNEDIHLVYGYEGRLKGSATTFPFGTSVIFRPTVGGTSEITLESGFRYVFVSSDVNVEVSDSYNDYSYSLGLDDGLVGLISADIAFPLSSTTKLGFGAGYQFDIYKGDVSLEGENLGGGWEQNSFFLRLGLTVKM